VADASAMPPALPLPLPRLDPTNDLVFKLLLTRTQVLLVDMLEAILGRPIASLTILNPGILGELASDKQVVLDIRVKLHDGTRVDVEMQVRAGPTLPHRLVYYVARDYADQLHRGDDYVDLSPSIGVVWLLEPVPNLPVRLHTLYELRERHTHERLTDQLAIHILQPLAPPSPDAFGYHPQVERWARFLTATSDAELDQLAAEDPIMTIAKDALDQLSQDPATHRLARERADAIKLYQIELAAYGRQARAEGEAKGEAKLLLKQLGLRFGPLSDAIRAQVAAASIDQLDTWAERILTATALDDVLAP
jgi:predicted transposase/invertase (TIGR01784 family)